jgi:hypothetical protein
MKVFNNVFVLVQDMFLLFQSHLQDIQYNLISQILLSRNILISLTIRSSVWEAHDDEWFFFFFLNHDDE